MANHIIYPIGVLTNDFMRKVIDKLVDQEEISLWLVLGDGGTLPSLSTNPTENTSYQEVGSVNNELVRIACTLSLVRLEDDNDTIEVAAAWECTAACDAKVVNEIALFDDEHYGDLMFYGWPSITKSTANIDNLTLAADDIYTFYIRITPAASTF